MRPSSGACDGSIGSSAIAFSRATTGSGGRRPAASTSSASIRRRAPGSRSRSAERFDVDVARAGVDGPAEHLVDEPDHGRLADERLERLGPREHRRRDCG